VRDRDAETIRQLLRAAGHQEFAGTRDGFLVEGGDDSLDGTQPFHVASSGDESAAATQAAQYAATLREAGYRVTLDLADACILQVLPA
jgi:hypothetical protein